MHLEAPIDGWYVWLAVSIVSAAVGTVALGLPTGPPPDANRAANAIEETAGSPYEASSTYDHDATAIKVTGRTVAMRNEHGTTRATLTYGHVVPVAGNERLENVSAGRAVEDEYAGAVRDPSRNAIDAFLADVESAYETNTDEWQTANGPLRTRTVATGAVPSVSATVDIELVPGDQTHEATFEYESTAETGIRLRASGSDDRGHIDERVTGTPTRKTETVAQFDENSAMSFPIDLRVNAGGTQLCTETVRTDRGDQPVRICPPGGKTLETTGIDDRGYVRRDTEADSFYVTLVDV
ncbi:hypothetical protein C488_03735 [Natrinema pellirubrum DSM 15624]|uniref:Uncharacterized protein n=1 Tax=Natrinema pellirubrum (strain DSM 15624 / CIP 106293 / JCM 10476 / NCIMB 786 / 157) TaxID=797303 RepID=L0JHF6_NATP1|nr:hypothetical protein [Natrinema pellirubrum]AGB30744.1 hypothetical protein Natpe_0827 [Natrinema pellirubrum DSM 15624]ELY80869.1 hypothetical protein C488_03735 [Natrinema pellirubrum DSM 15624]